MARACGSYPQCHWFKSNYRYQIRPDGQAAKTPPFHGGNTGSIPVRVTNVLPILEGLFGRIAQLVRVPASHAGGPRFESVCVHQAAASRVSLAAAFKMILAFLGAGFPLKGNAG